MKVTYFLYMNIVYSLLSTKATTTEKETKKFYLKWENELQESTQH